MPLAQKSYFFLIVWGIIFVKGINLNLLNIDHMQNEITSGSLPSNSEKGGALSRFLHWCTAQEQSRIKWIGFSILGYIGAVIPLTAMMIILSGNHFALWLIVIITGTAVLSVNLSAMPTKVTIPTLTISLVINIVIILHCLFRLIAGA